MGAMMSEDWNIHLGDNLEALQKMADGSVDAVVSDPPYGLSDHSPEDIAIALTAWLKGESYEHGTLRKGQKNCSTNVLRDAVVGHSNGSDTQGQKEQVSFQILIKNESLMPVWGIQLKNKSTVREVEVHHEGTLTPLEDVLMGEGNPEQAEPPRHPSFRLWKRKGTPGCVGVCTCHTETSSTTFCVDVWLRNDPVSQAEASTGEVALTGAECRAVLALDVTRGTGTLSAAEGTGDGHPLIVLAPTEQVGAPTGTTGSTPVLEPGGVDSVLAMADGTGSQHKIGPSENPTTSPTAGTDAGFRGNEGIPANLTLLLHDEYLTRLRSPRQGGKGFMGKGWDSFVPGPILWKECFRVLKPGGHLLAFAGTRTLDLMGMSLRLAGFEIRDGIAWLHGQGFPKSHDVSKALDKVAGTEFSERPAEGVGFMRPDGRGGYNVTRNRLDRVGESSPEAQEWAGWGTALKPAFEPVVVARKPLIGTIAANVLAHGTGAMNIDGCRVSWGSEAPTQEEWNQKGASAGGVHYGQISDGMRAAYAEGKIPAPTGRWPSNVILGHSEECERVGTKRVKANTEGSGKLWSHYRDNTEDQAEARKSRIGDEDGYETVESWNCVPDCPVSMLDEQSGELRPRGNVNSSVGGGGSFGIPVQGNNHHLREDLKDGGGASRFFYTAKASKNERTANGKVPNNHPTVKPLALMRYLCRLVTPPGGVVLDPFMGSGTTGVAARQEGFRFVGMEKDEDSFETARGRIALALKAGLWDDPVEKVAEPVKTTLSDLLGWDD